MTRFGGERGNGGARGVASHGVLRMQTGGGVRATGGGIGATAQAQSNGPRKSTVQRDESLWDKREMFPALSRITRRIHGGRREASWTTELQGVTKKKLATLYGVLPPCVETSAVMISAQRSWP